MENRPYEKCCGPDSTVSRESSLAFESFTTKKCFQTQTENFSVRNDLLLIHFQFD